MSKSSWPTHSGRLARRLLAFPASFRAQLWPQILFIAFLVGLLAFLNVYRDGHALDTSLLPRLRGLYVTLCAAVLLLLLPPVTARRVDLSVLRNPTVLCYGLFVFFCFATLSAALNPTAGLTDAFRSFGAFLFLCLLCLLLPTISFWQEKLLKVIACGSLLSIGQGYYEFWTSFGFNLGPHSREQMHSITAAMGNVNLYAGFLILVIPFCLCGVAVLRGAWRALSAFAAFTGFLMVVMLQTRAAYLGLAGSLTTAAVLLVIFSRTLGIDNRIRRVMLTLLAILPVLVTCFLLLAPEANPIASRLRAIAGNVGDSSADSRLMAWKLTLQMIADHFPYGVGTGNFTMRLDEYFNAQTDFRGVGTNWIYPHNDYLWVLVEQGLAGFLAFAGLFFFALRNCIVVLLRGCSVSHAWLAVAVIMVLSAYIVNSAFDFPLARVNHQLYLATALASSVVLVHRDPKSKRSPSGVNYPRGILFAVVPILAVLGFGIAYTRAAIKQEYYLSVVLALEEDKMYPAALRVLRAAATPWKTTDPFATPWAYHEARLLQLAGATNEEILEALERAYSENPNRLHTINDLGAYYGKVGRIDKAIELFTKTAQRYPNQIVCIENLAQCYIDLDDYAKALEILEGIPEKQRTAEIQQKIAGCRQALGDGIPAEEAAAP